MRVLNIAFALARVADDAVGGAEQVLAQLDRALVAAGHDSLVVADENSGICGTLVPTGSAPPQIGQSYYAYRYFEQQRKIKEALESGPFDLVHMHGYDFHEFIPAADVPVLVTLHLPTSWYPEWIYQLNRPRLAMNCVSDTQRRTAPNSALIVRSIHNGVSIPQLDPLPVEQRFGAVMMGRICPEKGTHIGITAAQKAGVTLVIAGHAFGYPEHQAYFNDCVLPAMNFTTKFVGPLGYRQRVELLRTCQCLLVPSSAPETSSLVSMEALACATPVIAMNSGALPEIVEHGRTGFIVNSEDEMAEAIGWLPQIDPATCRQSAIERFSGARMAQQYLNFYEQLIARDEPPGMERSSCPADLSQNC